MIPSDPEVVAALWGQGGRRAGMVFLILRVAESLTMTNCLSPNSMYCFVMNHWWNLNKVT